MISNQKIKNFRNKIYQIMEQELALRADIKQLYQQFLTSAEDDKMALRQVRQAFYQIQKHRIVRLLEDRLEFHPFFTASPFRANEMFDEDFGDDDGII